MATKPKWIKKLLSENDTCYWCNKIISKSDKTVEHILPKRYINNNKHTDNVVMSCYKCNHYRGSLEDCFYNYMFGKRFTCIKYLRKLKKLVIKHHKDISKWVSCEVKNKKLIDYYESFDRQKAELNPFSLMFLFL